MPGKSCGKFGWKLAGFFGPAPPPKKIGRFHFGAFFVRNFPEGTERHLNAGRQNCRETNFTAQLQCSHPHRMGSFEASKKSSLVGERQFGRHFKKQLGEGVIASQKLPRDISESIFAARHQDVSQGPLGS